MKILALIPIAAALALCGCQTTGTNSTSSAALQAITNPNNLAIAAQDSVNAGVALILARNPSYQPALVGLADSLAAIASSNPAQLSSSDVAAILGKSGISGSDAEEIQVAIVTAQGVFLSAFKGTSLPQLKPIYTLFLDAIANGIYLATGKPTITLPVVPVPAPAATPAPSS